jgi:uncharacterized protein
MSETTRQSIAEVATPKASRYLQQLCKHFQHKIPATFGATAGRIEFSIGECHLEGGADRLTLKLAAPDSERLAQLQEVVGSHLLRFAFRDGLQISWRETSAPTL